MGEGLVKINVAKIGNYCQKELKISPSAQTIRNMKVTIADSNIDEHVFKTYIEKRAVELSYAYPKSKKNAKASPPSYKDLVDNISDDMTRAWVRDLVQRLQFAENSADFMEGQLEKLSNQLNGLDIATAISAGPTGESQSLDMLQAPQGPTIEASSELIAALNAVLGFPNNSASTIFFKRGAMVLDSGTGPVILLTQQQLNAVQKAVQGGD